MWHSESCGSSIFFCLRASAKPFSLCLPKSLFNGHFHIKVFWFDWSMHWKHSFSIQQWSQSQLCKVAVTIECPFWKLHAYSQCHCVENTQQRGLIYTIVEPNTQRLHLANLIFFFALKETFFKDSYEQTKPSEWIVLRIPYVAMWGAQSVCGNMSSWESPSLWASGTNNINFFDNWFRSENIKQNWKCKLHWSESCLLFINYFANVPSHGIQMP